MVKRELFIIIQARMTSSRLEGKVMLPLCGKSVLEIMLKRLKYFHDNIIIATPKDEKQQPIIELCKKLGIKHYQGSEENVLNRYYEAALNFGAKNEDIIVRLTSDCPLIDQNIVKEIIEFYEHSNVDYVSNVEKRTFPVGMDTEVFSFTSLKEAHKNAHTIYDIEHVTPWIKRHLKTKNVKNGYDYSRYRLTLDTWDDYLTIKSIYELFDCKTDFSYTQLIEKLSSTPQITAINEKETKKEYEYSI